MNSLRARLTPVLAISVTPMIHKGPDEKQPKEAICSVSTIVSTALFSEMKFQMLTPTVFLIAQPQWAPSPTSFLIVPPHSFSSAGCTPLKQLSTL